MTLMLILFFSLLVLVWISYKSSYQSMLLSPQLGFVAGFLASVGYGLLWVKEYGIDLLPKTFYILSLGNLLFVVISIVSQRIFGRLLKNNHSYYEQTDNKVIYISWWKLLVFLLFQIVVLVWIIVFLSGLGNKSIADAIYVYRHANTFTDNKISMPRILSLARKISTGSSYFWGYYSVYTVIKKGKSSKVLLFANLGLGIINNVILGARTGAFVVIVSICVISYFLAYSNSNRKIKFSIIWKTVLILLVLVFSFRFFGNLLGRSISFNFSEYIAIYLSAEIKNLDTFVRKTNGGATLYNCQTLIYIFNWLSGKLGLPEWYHELDIPFMFYNGHNLGNVSTTFYAFYYDAGVWGVALYTSLMAIISSFFYIKTIKELNQGTNIFSFSLLMYSYMYFCFLFSFFSNKFYEHIFNPSLLWFIFTWLGLEFFVKRVHLKSPGFNS